ncbi:type II toxin-antitoxin system YafQ family toxin [Fructilactobacillus hinvesii]|uniref:Type II toxin-antitoxin system YafQ family toxin n=1 Tax=Fructilactobacillus hinvesii TaxID=2940300 RepID=A0ABY5BSJ3_9LACO|nr:type II toxin-antitoxin system YafQ family toxin [Fructilactobacillus hinvesii]USS88087.1 type II toxin-antitoxin system YafQ family toxin [Fructilactobacillus hinvesii]
MEIDRTKKFLKDVKRCKKKHWNIEKLEKAVRSIVENDERELKKLKNHSLKGDWQGLYELHIESNWLLIYRISNDRVILVLTRTGTHKETLGI